jgi:uncharacterized membrane protein HdeD (DUF308 family)
MNFISLKTVRNSIKYWYIPLIVGLIFVGVGIWVFMTPSESYVALSFIFSISFLVSGIFDIYFAVSSREELDNWGWTLALGIVSAIVGILLLMNPEVSRVTLPFYVGFVLLFRSVFAIGASLDLKDYRVLDWGYLMAIGILGVIFSFILLWNPLFAGMTLVFWTALLFIVSGAYSIYFSFKLKKLHDLPSEIPSDLKNKYEEIKNQIQEELTKGKE